MSQKMINDFCITICTVNGSGSATANNLILKALFKMGIPVSGKNIFPSNIQGLPTWYSIRVNKDGFLGRVEHDNIIIAMNPDSIINDLDYLTSNGVVLHNESVKIPDIKKDIIKYSMPVEKILNECNCPQELKTYLANMVYVGVLARIIGIDIEKIYDSLNQHFKGKESAIEPNRNVIQHAYDWTDSNLSKKDSFYIEPMNLTNGFIMADGNTAGALGSIYGGVQFIAWYPITPATSLPEAINEYLPKYRKEPGTGKNTYVSIQSEDELAAIGMVVGAGWAGLRAMTATSGPGLCLMSEYLGLAYHSEVPVVVWDVQRVGPSTGLPTRTSQGDLTFSYFLSHGDTDFVILLPGSVYECFEFGWKALDIADELQTPVIVLSDLDLGMNEWMTPKFEYPNEPIKRGKIVWEDDLQKLLEKRKGDWGRYVDIDDDGVPYRTVPGNQHPRAPYFTRGTGHDEYANYNEKPEVWERIHKRLRKKMEKAKEIIPAPVETNQNKATIGIISYGSNDPAVIETCYTLKKNQIFVDYLRIRSLPFSNKVEEFIGKFSKIYIVEANRDGQMAQIVKMSFPEHAGKIYLVAHMDGLSLSANWITNKILEMEGN